MSDSNAVAMTLRAKSADGTLIGYTVRGSGPALVMVQGAMGTSYNYRDLAEMLSQEFTVVTPDRRGRGMSPSIFNSDHRLEREVEDVQAVVEATTARYIFGLSSGAIIALQSAKEIDPIEKAVIYEPPLHFKSWMDKERIKKFGAEVNQGDLLQAFTTAGELVQLAPSLVQSLPRALRVQATRAFMRTLEGGNGYAQLNELIPAMLYDFAVVFEMDHQIDSFTGMEKSVLLLGGTKIPQYLKDALARLAEILPNSRRVTFPGLDHSAPWNAERGGAPATLAPEILKFLRA